MSDPKRATLITVGASKCAKNNVNKTVRLSITLDESTKNKYPELNYKELVIAEERKNRVPENGKTRGLDPFSDNDDDVKRVAREFEQKYGGKSTYGRKGRSKHDDFADIGAGYDENDSFIDNTHGYDEMIPPECDTFHGGFYINSGSLEFQTVPQDQSAHSDEPGRRNKRRISSSSSEEESSDSSSESESQDEKDTKVIANGAVDSHKTEHRKKKNKKNDTKTAKKVRRTDSSAATSGKQTSDENVQADGESVDSRTSHSDSLTSKPAPSSETAVTSDSSRDIEAKIEAKLPQPVNEVLEALEASVAKHLLEHPTTPAKQLMAINEQHILRLEEVLKRDSIEPRTCRLARTRAARALGVSTAKLAHRTRNTTQATTSQTATSVTSTGTTTVTTTSVTTTTTNNKRKLDEEDNFDPTKLTEEQREAMIVETLQRLKVLIEERKPGMIANYNAECERVQEERKKLQIAGGLPGQAVERRLPKRRFPWCGRSRALLSRLTRLANNSAAAATLLAHRVLPLFPAGFVRMPTLLRQADLSKEIKVSEIKRQRLGSATQVQPSSVPPQPITQPTIPFTESIQFPSSLTVTTTSKTSPDKPEVSGNDDKSKQNSVFGSIINSFSLSKDLIVEPEKKDDKKEDLYIPPNNIGSITITPVTTSKEKKPAPPPDKPGLIRVKSPAALNEMVKKDVKTKKLEKNHANHRDKRVESPLHIDTTYHVPKKDPSPKNKEEIAQKVIENLRSAENNIPRPALIPVHHSPTFAKPDKRPPEIKKKKELLIVSDVDPLSDIQEPLAVDDSSSDVEVIEVNSDKCEVPSKDKSKKVKCVPKKDGKEKDEDAANADIDTLMRNIREMEHSQEPTKYNSNSYGGVITTAKNESSKAGFKSIMFGDTKDKNKFTERTSLNKMDGCKVVTG